MENLIQTIKQIHRIDPDNFDFCFSVCYDDQGMENVEIAKENFHHLKANVLADSVNFFESEGIPSIFVFNYPDQYLTAQEFDDALSEVFSSDKPKVIWNQYETSALGHVNSFYPWVGPSASGWDRINGLEWGEDYLNWFYPTVNTNGSTLDFLCGGVWPGFDDRPNTSWGDNRWMDRQNGNVYNETWSILTDYSGELPMKFALIETWNDWNEGTEIEPSNETGYKYLKLTVDHINAYKGTNLNPDTVKFEAARQLYISSRLLEKNAVDSVEHYSKLELAIAYFLQKRFGESYLQAIELRNLLTGFKSEKSTETTSLIIFPGYEGGSAQISITAMPDDKTTVSVFDVNGRKTATLFSGFVLDSHKEILFNPGDISGIYFIVMNSGEKQITRKLVSW
jgi:hypothetical protein